MLIPLCRMTKWSNDENKSCRSRKFIKLCSWQIFYLNSFCKGKLRLKFSNLNFRVLNDLGWRNNQNESCRSLVTFWFEIILWRKTIFEFLKIWNLKFLNDLGWINNKNQSCRSRKVMKLCSWQLFDLKSSC